MRRLPAPVLSIAVAVALAGFVALGRRWSRRRAVHDALADAYVQLHARAMRDMVATASSSDAAETEPQQRVEARERS
jgi:hypothetical protein